MAHFRKSTLCVFVASLLAACSSGSNPSAEHAGSAGSGGNDAPATPTNETPAVVASTLCVISADCPAGAHCDLGECIQDCNVNNACGSGDSCSSRARCLSPTDVDQDPTPSAAYKGTVSAGPLTTLLTESDKSLKVTLKSTSRDPVQYRIQLAAPHLSTKELRGVFTGSTDVQFAVDSSKLKGQQDVPGSIKFFTTLGDISVNAPIHTGITGKYRGALRYDGGLVNLGDARLAVDVIEKNGEVTVQFDPAQSLLLPKTAAGPATGYGSYAPGQPIELNGSQLIDHSFGGTRNHFGRDIGRKIQLTLTPSGSGNLSGTFTDNIYGLFQEPVKLSGTVTLQYQPHAGAPDFTLSPDAAMPDSPVASPSPRVFGWDGDSCALTLAGPCGGGYNVIDESTCYKQIETAYSQPLYDAMAGTSLDFNALATQCDSAMAAKGYSDPATGCGLVAPLACALSDAADRVHDATNGPAFNRLMQEALAPALLISQNHVVQALKDSFNAGGALAELQRYDSAMAALDPIAQWVFMPNIVEYLRTMDPKIAEGADSAAATETQDDSYPAARALSKLLTVMTTIDGERARVSGVASPSAQTDLVTQAQARAVLSYLETVTLVDTLNEWKIAPPSIAADFTGVLTPLDTGFGDLINGAGAFGVPDSFVPFVYNPKNVAKGTSNFEQMSSIASEAVASYKALEDEYRTNDRTFEQNEDTLRQQVVQVQTTYGAQISDTCGASFDISAIKSPADWSSCGANDQGQVGLQLIQIDEAMSRLQSSLSRIQGMKDKIAIDRRVLAQTQNVHEDTLNFIDDTGTELDAITWSQGIIDAEQAAIQTAAQSSVMDFGAAAGLSVVTLALGVAKTELDVQRQDVQTAQTMHAEQASAQIELLNGMGNIQKETIDLAQLGVEMQQDVISLHEARATAVNAVEQAQRTFNDRGKAVATLALSPAHDPSFRLLRDQEALDLLSSRARAQQQLYLSGQALEYEINEPVNSMPGAVLNARNALSMDQLTSCLKQVANGYQTAYGVPQSYSTTVSVRAMLGITGPRTDSVTGEMLTEGQQFREILLQNQNLDGKGGVGITFATDLQPGNQLWSTDVCADRIDSVQAQLVGDFLGDNEAQVNLSLSGAALLRDCGGDDVTAWSFGSQSGSSDASAVIQAGVNTFGTAAAENASLFGQSVARASWHIAVPGGDSAPANADIDLTHLDDITLLIKHEALPQKNSPLAVDLSCLASIK